jgi:hypothetical protein
MNRVLVTGSRARTDTASRDTLATVRAGGTIWTLTPDLQAGCVQVTHTQARGMRSSMVCSNPRRSAPGATVKRRTSVAGARSWPPAWPRGQRRRGGQPVGRYPAVRPSR